MKRRTFSIGGFFSLMIAIFLFVVLAQAGISMYFHIAGRLDAAKDRAETFQKTVSVLLRKQVEAAEEIIRTVASGKSPMQDAGGSVLVIALMDGKAVQLSIKGWLPNGLELPNDILTPEWTATDLLDAYGRNLLARVTKIGGLHVFAAISPDMRDFGNSRARPFSRSSSTHRGTSSGWAARISGHRCATISAPGDSSRRRKFRTENGRFTRPIRDPA